MPGLEQIQHSLDLFVQAARMQVQIPQPGKAEEIVEQVLQPRDLLLDEFHLAQARRSALALRFAKSSASRSMFMRITDSGFLISCASEPASSASSL